jgi:capsule polysaccharide export protein KpsE/RkpR
MASITNAVLNERQQQQFTQTMVLLAQIKDHLATMNGSVREEQILGAEQELRINCLSKHIEKMEQELKKSQDRAVRLALAVALLTGMGMAGANKIFSLVIP